MYKEMFPKILNHKENKYQKSRVRNQEVKIQI